MAITWDRAPNGRDIFLGLEITQSPSTVTYDTTSVTLTGKVYFKAEYSTYDTSNTLSWSGLSTGSSSNEVNWPSAKTGTELIKTLTKTVTLTSSSQSKSWKVDLAGIGTAGGTMSVTVSKTVPARPPGIGYIGYGATNGSPTIMDDTASPIDIYFNNTANSPKVKLSWKFGTASGDLISNASSDPVAATHISWDFPSDVLAPGIPNETSGTGTFYCKYYESDNTYIGQDTRSFTVSLPANIVPDAGTMTLTEGNSTVSTVMGTMSNTFVQTKSEINVAYAGQAGAKGSTVTKVEIIDSDGNTHVVSASPYKLPTLTTNGTTVTKRVTDSRGRTSTVPLTITVLPYSPPKVTSFSAPRSNGSTESSTGTDALAKPVASVSSLINGTQKNTLTWAVSSRVKGTTTWTPKISSTLPLGILAAGAAQNTVITGPYNLTGVYEFQLVVSDKFGSSAPVIYTMSSEVIPLAISQYGIGVGKAWAGPESLDVKGGAAIEGTLSINGEPIQEVKSLGAGIDLNTLTTTGYYVQSLTVNATPALNYPEALAGMLRVVSRESGNMVWQEYTTYGSSNRTYKRGYYEGTWFEWAFISGPEVISGSVVDDNFYIKYANGDLVCRGRHSFPANPGVRQSLTWTYPVAFTENPQVTVTIDSTAPDTISVAHATPTPTGCVIWLHRSTSLSTNVYFEARGRWK